MIKFTGIRLPKFHKYGKLKLWSCTSVKADYQERQNAKTGKQQGKVNILKFRRFMWFISCFSVFWFCWCDILLIFCWNTWNVFNGVAAKKSSSNCMCMVSIQRYFLRFCKDGFWQLCILPCHSDNLVLTTCWSCCHLVYTYLQLFESDIKSIRKRTDRKKTETIKK